MVVDNSFNDRISRITRELKGIVDRGLLDRFVMQLRRYIHVSSRVRELQSILDSMRSTDNVVDIISYGKRALEILSDPSVQKVVPRVDEMARDISQLIRAGEILLDLGRLVESGQYREALELARSNRDVLSRITDADKIIDELRQVVDMGERLDEVKRVIENASTRGELEKAIRLSKNILMGLGGSEDVMNWINTLNRIENAIKVLGRVEEHLRKGDIEGVRKLINENRSVLHGVIDIDKIMENLDRIASDIDKYTGVFEELEKALSNGDYGRAITVMEKNKQLLVNTMGEQSYNNLLRRLRFVYEIEQAKTPEQLIGVANKYMDIVSRDSELYNYIRDVNTALNIMEKIKTAIQVGKIDVVKKLIEENKDILYKVYGRERVQKLVENISGMEKEVVDVTKDIADKASLLVNEMDKLNKMINTFNEKYRRITRDNYDNAVKMMDSIVVQINRIVDILNRYGPIIQPLLTRDVNEIRRELLRTRRVLKDYKLYLHKVRQFETLISEYSRTLDPEKRTALINMYNNELLPLAKKLGIEGELVNEIRSSGILKIMEALTNMEIATRDIENGLGLMSSSSALTREEGRNIFIRGYEQYLKGLSILKELGYDISKHIDQLRNIKKDVIVAGMIHPIVFRTIEDRYGINISIPLEWYEQIEVPFRFAEEVLKTELARSLQDMLKGDAVSILKSVGLSAITGLYEIGSGLPLVRDNLQGLSMLVSASWDTGAREALIRYFQQPENIASFISTLGWGVLIGKYIGRLSPRLRFTVNAILGNIDDMIADTIKLVKPRIKASFATYVSKSGPGLLYGMVVGKSGRIGLEVLGKDIDNIAKTVDIEGTKALLHRVKGLYKTIEPEFMKLYRGKLKQSITRRVGNVLHGKLLSKLRNVTRELREAPLSMGVEELLEQLRTRIPKDKYDMITREIKGLMEEAKPKLVKKVGIRVMGQPKYMYVSGVIKSLASEGALSPGRYIANLVSEIRGVLEKKPVKGVRGLGELASEMRDVLDKYRGKIRDLGSIMVLTGLKHQLDQYLVSSFKKLLKQFDMEDLAEESWSPAKIHEFIRKLRKEGYKKKAYTFSRLFGEEVDAYNTVVRVFRRILDPSVDTSIVINELTKLKEISSLKPQMYRKVVDYLRQLDKKYVGYGFGELADLIEEIGRTRYGIADVAKVINRIRNSVNKLGYDLVIKDLNDLITRYKGISGIFKGVKEFLEKGDYTKLVVELNNIMRKYGFQDILDTITWFDSRDMDKLAKAIDNVYTKAFIEGRIDSSDIYKIAITLNKYRKEFTINDYKALSNLLRFLQRINNLVTGDKAEYTKTLASIQELMNKLLVKSEVQSQMMYREAMTTETREKIVVPEKAPGVHEEPEIKVEHVRWMTGAGYPSLVAELDELISYTDKKGLGDLVDSMKKMREMLLTGTVDTKEINRFMKILEKHLKEYSKTPGMLTRLRGFITNMVSLIRGSGKDVELAKALYRDILAEIDKMVKATGEGKYTKAFITGEVWKAEKVKPKTIDEFFANMARDRMLRARWIRKIDIAIEYPGGKKVTGKAWGVITPEYTMRIYKFTKDGKDIWLSLMFKPIRDKLGRVRYVEVISVFAVDPEMNAREASGFIRKSLGLDVEEPGALVKKLTKIDPGITVIPFLTEPWFARALREAILSSIAVMVASPPHARHGWDKEKRRNLTRGIEINQIKQPTMTMPHVRDITVQGEKTGTSTMTKPLETTKQLEKPKEVGVTSTTTTPTTTPSFPTIPFIPGPLSLYGRFGMGRSLVRIQRERIVI